MIPVGLSAPSQTSIQLSRVYKLNNYFATGEDKKAFFFPAMHLIKYVQFVTNTPNMNKT
jgi:hypothetical protein